MLGKTVNSEQTLDNFLITTNTRSVPCNYCPLRTCGTGGLGYLLKLQKQLESDRGLLSLIILFVFHNILFPYGAQIPPIEVIHVPDIGQLRKRFSLSPTVPFKLTFCDILVQMSVFFLSLLSFRLNAKELVQIIICLCLYFNSMTLYYIIKF